MKKPYQIGAGRAVQRVRQWAEEKNPAVQLMLPMIEILALAKQGAGELVREAGLRVILLAIQQEADALTGARHHHGPDRQALRWSREDGFVVVDGQKVPIERRRLRSKNGGEVRLGTYELFQQTRTLDDEVWWKMLRGLTTRNYPLVTRSFAQAYGIEKSATSERFIQASRDKLKELMERPLGELKLCALVIDGTPFKGRQMMAAIGVATPTPPFSNRFRLTPPVSGGSQRCQTVLCTRSSPPENAWPASALRRTGAHSRTVPRRRLRTLANHDIPAFRCGSPAALQTPSEYDVAHRRCPTDSATGDHRATGLPSPQRLEAALP
jgi:hypothetical protein